MAPDIPAGQTFDIQSEEMARSRGACWKVHSILNDLAHSFAFHGKEFTIRPRIFEAGEVSDDHSNHRLFLRLSGWPIRH